jgi:D-arabinose 1-dehydrogenase-like Zn-dependent alcohol dehydrogenase
VGVDPVLVAPHADAGLTAYHAVRRIAHLLLPGSVAVVLGVGGVGHIALQLVRELGAASVVAVDVDAGRRTLAAELGADEVLDGRDAADAVRELTSGRGADVVLDVVGTNDTHTASLDMLARRGTYALVGYGGTISRPSIDLVVDENTAVGNLVGTWPDLWEVLQLQAAGRLELRTETHPLDAINDVLARLRAGEVTGRAVIAH